MIACNRLTLTQECTAQRQRVLGLRHCLMQHGYVLHILYTDCQDHIVHSPHTEPETVKHKTNHQASNQLTSSQDGSLQMSI